MKTKNQSNFKKHGKGNHSNIVTKSEIQNTKTQKLKKNKKRKITKEETAKHILELREILNQPKKSVLKKVIIFLTCLEAIVFFNCNWHIL